MQRDPFRENQTIFNVSTRPRLALVLRAVRYCAAIVTVVALLEPSSVMQTAAAAPSTIGLHSSKPSNQPVGTSITWTASAAGLKSPVYRFNVSFGPGASAIVRDFSPTPSFSWTPLHEGSYTIVATVKDGFTATSTQTASRSFSARSRVSGKNAVVSATANPLVALYSVPACTSGAVTVMFRPAGSVTWQSLPARPCTAGQSVNVLIAGMRASTAYALRHVVTNGSSRMTSPTLTFTTGKPAAALKFPTFTVKRAAASGADLGSSLLFDALNPSPSPAFANPVATDLSGHLTWYYDTIQSGLGMVWPLRLVNGGTVLLFGRDRYRATGDNVLREIDLAGDALRETNIDAVNAQLAKRGLQPIYAFHHDALRLPNGNTAVIGETQKKVGTRDIMGDMVVVLDANFQVVWTWDMFDHLTPSSKLPAAVVCGVSYPNTLCAVPDLKALDWTHSNGLGYSTADGGLTLSIRHLDQVIKIDYQGGKGSGKVLWTLGQGGDFTIASTDPSPWFSHQHNAQFVNDTTMVLFDNGNTRCQNGTVKGCVSRGQELKVDQKKHTVTPVVNVSLGVFSQALGSAQVLANGNLTFGGGYPLGSSTEFQANGTMVYKVNASVAEYRVYRLATLAG